MDDEPVHLPGGRVLISNRQRSLHIVSETIALGVGIPLSIYAATRKELPPGRTLVSIPPKNKE
jgi:hypothetical protein